MERKIGEIFEFEGVKLQAVKKIKAAVFVLITTMMRSGISALIRTIMSLEQSARTTVTQVQLP